MFLIFKGQFNLCVQEQSSLLPEAAASNTQQPVRPQQDAASQPWPMLAAPCCTHGSVHPEHIRVVSVCTN